MLYKITERYYLVIYHHWQYTGFEPGRVLNLALEGENSTISPSSPMVEGFKIDNRENILVYYVQFGGVQIGHGYYSAHKKKLSTPKQDQNLFPWIRICSPGSGVKILFCQCIQWCKKDLPHAHQ